MKNHYIPQFYTKMWAQNRRLVLYHRPRGSVVMREKYPSEVGFGNDIYTYPGIDDATRFDLETKFFRRIDQKACDIAQKICENCQNDLAPEERVDWITFLISLRQRNPQKMEEIAARARTAFLRDREDYRARYDLQKKDSRTFDEFIADLETSGWFERKNKELISAAILLPKTTETIMSFSWSMHTINNREHDLLTSDRPVITSVGNIISAGNVILPMGPRCFFLAAQLREDSLRVARSKDFGRHINDMISKNAYEQVYGSRSRQLAFVEKRLRCK